ncbi:hypothetical protein WOLCODRAFT_158931 [Wolfiporia cocos MD-104 SS10]|uniref:Uncharacterized protein n=1 Tax=Wolfiporia cocos (strain MD-104) TaxID=742152 RepID=A0A2H3JNR3_WOLCO|nr:hypothetical protein WOLCODRAFT_158931 [Wolfiporia cocos MD-104 SS10]
MDDFRTWVDMRPRAPVGLIVSVDEQKTEAQTGDSPADHVRVQVEASPGLKLRSARCLGTRFRRLDVNLSSSLSAHLDISLDSASVSTDPDLGAILATTLLEESIVPTVITDDRSELEDGGDQAQKQKQIPTYSARDAEVLLVHWDVHRQLYLPSDSALIEYSSKLWALAEKLAASLGPYLAVHWRPEKLPPALVSACSDALVDALDMLLHDETSAYGIKSILLVTDRPSSGSDLNAIANNKEAETAQKHMEASKVLKTVFAPGGELEKWSLTNLADELARINASLHHGGSLNITSDGDETAILGDPGVVGILRKMVATTSDLFVSSRGRCGVTR